MAPSSVMGVHPRSALRRIFPAPSSLFFALPPGRPPTRLHVLPLWPTRQGTAADTNHDAAVAGPTPRRILQPFSKRKKGKTLLVLATDDRPSVESTRRHVIVTGANSGIGKATALELAKKGMAVTLACRNERSGEAAAREITQASNSSCVRFMKLDLDSLASVRQFVLEYKDADLPLHVLVNNAGIMACPQSYTEDGFERQLGVNHLGHFLLTSLLIKNLAASASAERMSRVVVLASAAERIGALDFQDLNYKGSRGYNNWVAYGQSKLANCLFSLELAKRCRNSEVPIISNSMHPGIVNTELIRYVFPGASNLGENPFWRFSLRLFGLKTAEEGASTAVFLASAPEVESMSGLYFENSRECTPSRSATDPDLASRLWDASMALTSSPSFP